MQLKDHYKTLHLPLTATQQEIKKAYRQLAMKYHPDKNAGNEISEARFREIQEAYHVLSDPSRRSAYNQQRWYRQSNRKHPAEEISPEMLLNKCRKLGRYVASLDASRINEEPLYQYISQLLTGATVNVLLAMQQPDINNQVITELLHASKPLSYRHCIAVSEQLFRLAGGDEEMTAAIRLFLKQRKLSGYWQQYQFVFIMIITLVICWIIFKISS